MICKSVAVLMCVTRRNYDENVPFTEHIGTARRSKIARIQMQVTVLIILCSADMQQQPPKQKKKPY